MSTTLKVPATMGATVEVTGDIVGSFLVHRNMKPTFTSDDVKYLWSVTHVATGLRFPWEFNYKIAARGFAKDVEALMDWSFAKAEMDRIGIKGKWVSGAPTKGQTVAIYAAAEARGAIT